MQADTKANKARSIKRALRKFSSKWTKAKISSVETDNETNATKVVLKLSDQEPAFTKSALESWVYQFYKQACFNYIESDRKKVTVEIK